MTNINMVCVQAEKVTSYGLQISGHAGYDTSGKDIVCAGVSAITYALAEWLQENNGGRVDVTEMRLEPGDVRIAWHGDGRDVAQMAAMGYAMLEQQYPDNVFLEMMGLGDANCH